MPAPLQGEIEEYWFADARVRLLHQDADCDVQEMFYPAGACTPLHVHTRYTEYLMVIGGELEGLVDDQHVHGSAGQLFEVPPGVPHAVLAGPEGLHVIAVSRPALFAHFCKSLSSRTDEPLDMVRLVEVSAEVGDEILGPPDVVRSRLDELMGR